jgi:hypothetical protein
MVALPTDPLFGYSTLFCGTTPKQAGRLMVRTAALISGRGGTLPAVITAAFRPVSSASVGS